MRIFLMLPAVALAACAPTTQTAYSPDQAHLDAVLAERVKGPALVCIPFHGDLKVRAIGHRLVFGAGDDLYINQTEGGCENAGTMGSIFLLDSGGPVPSLCQHTSVRVISGGNGMFAGNCNLSQFIPYRVQ